MRLFIAVAAGCLALTPLPAAAAPITFAYTGAIVDYAVPVTGQYTITAIGARGGSVLDNGGTGGLGAEAGGTFSLVQGEVLSILAGGAGADNPVASQGFEGFAGGGGGSFVVGPNGAPLVVAGGGGGGGQLNAAYPPDFQEVRGGSRYNGSDASTGPDGTAATVVGGVSLGGAGGTGGSDGSGGSFGPGASAVNAGRGFDAFPSGLGAGAFGGGGLADDDAGAGGGGGYSGGGGGGAADLIGTLKYGIGGGGGGGGSFSAGTDPILLARIGTGDGQVAIAAVAAAVPEPGSGALLGMGALGLAVLRRSRRQRRFPMTAERSWAGRSWANADGS